MALRSGSAGWDASSGSNGPSDSRAAALAPQHGWSLSPRSGRTPEGSLPVRMCVDVAGRDRVGAALAPGVLANPRLHPAGPDVLMEVSVVPLTGHMLRTSG